MVGVADGVAARPVSTPTAPTTTLLPVSFCSISLSAIAFCAHYSQFQVAVTRPSEAATVVAAVVAVADAEAAVLRPTLASSEQRRRPDDVEFHPSKAGRSP